MKNIQFTNKSKYILIALILINISLFIYTNITPINWMIDEMPCYYFYWSMNDINDLGLHSGLNINDFKKPFISRFNDGAFRTRQISYFFEMLSFKFWQYMGVGYFRNYTLIAIHIINTLLLWFLVYLITKNKWGAYLTSFLFLNAGISLLTLLFPFRLGKIIIVTLFLLNFILLTKLKEKASQIKSGQIILFYILSIVSFFIDETFIFLFFLYIVFLLLDYKNNKILFLKIIKLLPVYILILAILTYVFYNISENAIETIKSWHSNYISNYFEYFKNPKIAVDTFKAFFNYFLRRNFGYWKISLFGILSFTSFFTILFLSLKSKESKKYFKFSIALIAFILAKSLLMPHIRIHEYIMPQNTFFPSMLFFSYYYTYIDSIIFILSMGILFNGFLKDKSRIIIFLTLITIINISNVVYKNEGLIDTLKFHNLDNYFREKIILDVKLLKKFLSRIKNNKIYISFPAGNAPILDGRWGYEDKTWSVYAAYIVTMLLPDIENGKAIVSFYNFYKNKQNNDNKELIKSDLFYDVNKRDLFDLNIIKQKYGKQALKPKILIEKELTDIDETPIVFKRANYIFFIKGESEFNVEMNDKIIKKVQTYGWSYEKFSIHLKKDNVDFNLNIKLKVKPLESSNEVAVIGPFIIPN